MALLPDRGTLRPGEIRVAIRKRGTTDAADRALLERLARQASGVPSLRLSRRCSHCGSSDHGVPTVDTTELFVSLSRSGDTVAFAVSGAPVGIDIESLAAVARRHVDEVAFTVAERARLTSAPDPNLLRTELWAGKEAVLKLRGTGLRVEPGNFELTDVAEPLHQFDAGAGLIGVVAGRGRISTLG